MGLLLGGLLLGSGGGFGGGGGGGLVLRDPADEFVGADLAACRVARNTYFAAAANADALGEFQGNQSLAIILNPANSTDNVFETYRPGSDVGDAYDAGDWLERTDSVQGGKGDEGEQARFVVYAYINAAVAPAAAPVGGTFLSINGCADRAGWLCSNSSKSSQRRRDISR